MGIHALVAAFAIALVAQTGPVKEVLADGQTVYEPGNGVSNPELLRKADPKYTAEAKRAGITGEVWLDAVVQTSGIVKVLGIKKSLDRTFGLDEAAIEAAKGWLFKPGMLDGKPVPVRVILIMEFGAQGAPKRPLAADFAKGTIKPDNPDVDAVPIMTKKITPAYTAEALRQKIQGIVEVEAIVGEDGSVKDARIAKSLDTVYGLDDKALAAARQFRFTPGTYRGKPAAFDMILKIEFKIH